MSRKNYPTQLRDHLGNDIKLATKPFATGGEGSVFDVTGRPDLVAKLYSKPQSKDRCDKLQAMAKLCSPDLLKIAAWPTATLSNGHPSTVEGILMPRIRNHKEIHNLYTVAQRKKDYPQVDWGFLLHTARNCAIAFESVHRHGHVVGDVNQKNVMVSEKGIIALVDCDSFQVKEGYRIFRCGVGVPEYTPPELQGRKFSELDRSDNHDLFGLAVMIFQLLMMGRHPFAGVPQVSTDIPIDKAIQDGLYAYTRNPTKLKPPPQVPPITILNQDTRELFERAFRSQQRPTATEWRKVLDASLNGLQRCKNDPKHSYPASGDCPWCQLIAASRLMFFIPSQPSASSALQIEDIQNLIRKLAGMWLSLASYVRPNPILPIEVTLPPELRNIQKPDMLLHPVPPPTLPSPQLNPLPPLPILLPRPKLHLLPSKPQYPDGPLPSLQPPAPAKMPALKLRPKPPPPIYPPLPSPDPPDRFLENLFLSVALLGLPVYWIAPPVGLIVMVGLGTAWLVLKLLEGTWQNKAQKSLKRSHDIQCGLLDQEYKNRIRPLEVANRRIIKAWESANDEKAAVHARLCSAIDDEYRSRCVLWEAAKTKIRSEHQQLVREIEQANSLILAEWERENTTLQNNYDLMRRKVEIENLRLVSVRDAVVASQQAEHRQKCNAIDETNRQRIASWEAANAPWLKLQKRWRGAVSAAEESIKKLETILDSSRQKTSSRIKQLKGDAEAKVKSYKDARSEYDRELSQAERNSSKIQLEEHLDKSLIRRAKQKGISGNRLTTLESFGIETANDVIKLNYQKVPGIGPVYTQRLLKWRENIEKKFKPRSGIPESEKKRIASRYAPVLLPLVQTLQSAINEIESLTASHRNHESELIKSIAISVQELAIAQAYVRKMKIV